MICLFKIPRTQTAFQINHPCRISCLIGEQVGSFYANVGYYWEKGDKKVRAEWLKEQIENEERNG